MGQKFNMADSMSRVTSEAIALYLKSNGWTERSSRYEDHFYFEGEIHAGGEPYHLYIPASQEVPKYRTLLQRIIYKLSGIEDRQPPEIIRDIFENVEQAQPSASVATRQCIRVRNSGKAPMKVRLSSRADDHQLMPDESIELICTTSGDEVIEIVHSDSSILIRDGK